MNSFLIVFFFDFFLLIKTSHFLGGSFTYRQNPNENFHNNYLSIFVEIRFHISHHYFQCTDEYVNQHMQAYLVGDIIPYDQITNKYDWFQVQSYLKNPLYYNINCKAINTGQICENFRELIWGYCESANEKLQYSFLRRQFELHVSRSHEISIHYESCCWATTTNKPFFFTLHIYPTLNLNNSSPYPYIPASYYVNYYQPKDIQILIYDADGDDIQCETHENNLDGFLTVIVSHDCRLSYQTYRLGKQFGQFWLKDKRNNQILSSSLISVQIHVLVNMTCNQQPELIVKNKQDNSKLITIEINQPVYISVSINPNCPNIPIEIQTIIELTTFCANEKPTITADGGIQIIFQCIPILCQMHYICFIGEFNMTLPSTDVICFQINAIGNDEQCANAAREYNYLEPHDRNFKIWKPIDKKVMPISDLTKTKSNIRITTIKPTQSNSRIWFWLSIVSVSILVVGSIGYFCFKRIADIYREYLIRYNQQQRLSDVNDSFDTIDSDIIIPKLPPKHNDTSLSLETHSDTISISSTKSKTRSQHLRFDLLDEYT